MQIKKAAISSIVMMIMVAMTACSGNSSAPATSGQQVVESKEAPASGSGWKGERTYLSVGGAAAGGSLYSLAVGVADLFSKEIKGVQATGEETGGSIENMNLIHQKKIDLANGTPDVAKSASLGTDPFKEPIKLTLGWRYADSHFHIVVRKNSGIKSVADMVGKKISIGKPGSGGNTNARSVLKAHGIDESKFTPVYLGWNEAAEALQDGSIDAAFNYGTLPAASIQAVISQADVQLLSVDPKIIEGIKEVPYTVGTIPAGTYQGLNEDVTVPVIGSFGFLSPELPEELAYEMAKVVDTNLQAFPKMAAGGKNTRLANEDDAKLIGINVHPGVLRYLKEKEGK